MKKSRKVAYAIVIVVIIAIGAYILNSNSNSNSSAPKIGFSAPNYSFIYASNGTVANVASLKGKPVLLWFVATWCSGCAVGNEELNYNMSFFQKHGINVVEVELYKDLGYNGAPISSFVNEYAPNATKYGNFYDAISSYNLSVAYDSKGYLDIYYLIGPNGKILYENDGSLAATLPQLKYEISSLANEL
ncbi:MAG: redoxin domain-containing protein [Candidatus Marsarchaeota archaeon]|jgi:thiol-disulfide isomerase/thioredoxin|uniref:Alkyl hydroperoxide reductase/ Thiol specific antioxidant/ Mal allergen n=1 Tax=mine drainage metagenome TaxID=410659 RepID=T1BY90_9ZZZZ|nr:redoxin domain-containing protein [Candidatus Marsarchaeota archaeon]